MEIDFSPYRFQAFTPEWERPLIALIEGCYAEYGQRIELDTLDDDLHRIEEEYLKAGGAFQVLLDKERLIGSVAVKLKKEGEAELKRVFLDPEYRGKGIGKKLSLWAFGFAAGRGCRMLHVWSDALYETAHHLYRRLGAEDTGKRRRLGGVNDVWERYFAWPIRGDE